MIVSIERLRQILKEELLNYVGHAPVLLPYDINFLNELLFYKDGCCKKIVEMLKPVLSKINFSNVSFYNFNAKNFDFSLYNGIKIDPQTLYEKDLSGAICKGVEFIGNFNGVDVRKANFAGSTGAKINPQTVKYKSLCNTICTDVEFIGANGNDPYFYGVDKDGTTFSGSNYKEAAREENEFREKIKSIIYSLKPIE